jgi:precorrin-2/cobalt-factor-2 C20-methyltransferase
MTYSTFGYILRIIKSDFPETLVETIPGITSYQAAASRINTPLVEAEESLLITSGAFGGERLRKIAPGAENIVLLKAYKNIRDISMALEEVNCLKNSFAIRKCGRQGEEIIDDIRELEQEKPDYWTLIMAKRSGE